LIALYILSWSYRINCWNT